MEGKRIATLYVEVKDNGRESTRLRRLSDTESVLLVDAKFDQLILNKIGMDVKDAQLSIVAHELGHWLLDLGLTKAEQGDKVYLERTTNTTSYEEERAWTLAKEIYPELSEKVRKLGLGTYKGH